MLSTIYFVFSSISRMAVNTAKQVKNHSSILCFFHLQVAVFKTCLAISAENKWTGWVGNGII